MNDRIQELARQARKNSARWGVYMEEEFYEKFAELIVRECIRLCDQVDLVGADDCIDNIRDHFGVE